MKSETSKLVLNILLIPVVVSAELSQLSNDSLMMIAEDIWRQDLSKEMRIGASTKGYDYVGLRCGAERMTVELRTSEDFSGVIYTQGSFHSRESACFLDPVRGRSFTMSIPLDQCDTERVSESVWMS